MKTMHITDATNARGSSPKAHVCVLLSYLSSGSVESAKLYTIIQVTRVPFGFMDLGKTGFSASLFIFMGQH